MAKFAIFRRPCGRIDYYKNGTTIRGRKGMGPAVVWLRSRVQPGDWIFVHDDLDYCHDNPHKPMKPLFEAFCARLMPVEQVEGWSEVYTLVAPHPRNT